MGGISNGTDAVEFLLAGASAVMVAQLDLLINGMGYTVEGIKAYMQNNVSSVTERRRTYSVIYGGKT